MPWKRFNCRSVGSKDFNLANITFTDANVNTGKALFINGAGTDPNFTGTCNFCHTNAGANVTAATSAPPDQNRNFNTNVEDRDHPSRTAARTSWTELSDRRRLRAEHRVRIRDGTFGNRTFNTASVVEAADTAPFFHNNVVTTLEDAVAFYSGAEFIALPPAVRKIQLH